VALAGGRLQVRQVVAVLVLACALVAGGIYWARAHRAAGPSNLVLYLPAANASVIYIDVDALRKSGILNLVAGSKALEDADYKQFLSDTKFDYRQDLDTVAAAFKDGKVYFALRGRFHWSNLKDYAVRQGGSCHDEFCVLPGSQPTRRISFYPLQQDVMAMAIGPDDFGAYQVSSKAQGLAPVPPKEPVWALIPAIELQRMDSLPAAARAYVPALQGAEQIVFSVSADANKQLQLGVQATCKDPTAASTLLAQFENITNALRQELAKAHQKADPADLSGVLVAGSFRRSDREVYGAWPIPRALLDALAAGY
jgi:hypothetical protein